METIIVSIVCIALVVFGGMTMSRGFMTSVDASTTGLGEIGNRDEIVMRTVLTPVSTTVTAANTLEITLRNSGQTKLADFNNWDVIVQYTGTNGAYNIVWLPYVSTLVNNSWTVVWIRINGAAEVTDPGILNTEEEILIRVQLSPNIRIGDTNRVVISTPSGITCSAHFVR